MSAEKAWNTVEEVAQYEEEGWNDPIFPKEKSLNYENANMEQILGIMKSQVDSLMKDEISLILKSESLCGISNEIRHLPPEPSHQEAFKGLLMNFILDQEEKVRQLEEYMGVIGSDFMQLSLEVIENLKEEIRIKENSFKRIQKITRPGKSINGPSSSSRELIMEESVLEFRVFDNDTHQMNYHSLATRSIHSRTIIDSSFFTKHGLETDFFRSINTYPFSDPQWVNLFQINEPIYQELVCKFFTAIEFDVVASRASREFRIRTKTRTGDDYRDGDQPKTSNTTPPVPPPTQKIPHIVSSIKLPILKKGEYDISAMKMEQYLSHTDYPIWQVIHNENGPVSVTTDTHGMIKVFPSKTAEEVVARERERKARTTSLMALPEDHLAKFHKIADAKEMFQTLLSQLEIHGAGVSHEDANQKFLWSLPSSWSQVALIMRTKPGTNDVSTAYSVSFPSILKSQKEGSSSYTDKAIHYFFANQSSAPQLDYDDLEQINDENMKELDFKWQTKVECFNCHKMGHFSIDYRVKGNQDKRRRDIGYNENKARDNDRRPAYQDDSKALVTINGEDIDWYGHVEEDVQNYATMAYSFSNSDSDNEKLLKKEYLKTKFENWQNSSKNLNRLLNKQMSANDKFRLGYRDYKYGSILSYENEVLQSVFMSKESDLEDAPVNDRYVEGMHAVPPLMTRNYMPSIPDVEIDYSKFTYGPKQTSVDESKAKTSEYTSFESDSSVETTTSVHEYESNSDDDSVSNVQEDKEKPSFAFTDPVKHVKTTMENIKETSTPNHYPKVEKKDINGHTRKGLGYAFTRKACFVCGSFSHLIRDCDFHEKRMAKQATLIKSKNKDDPHKALKDKGIINSGCSRHMTKNKAYLADYQEFKGGSVAFGGSNGRKTEEIDLHEEHFILPIWSAYSTTVKSSRDKIVKNTDVKTCKKPVSQVEQIFLGELEKLKRQEKEANDAARKETTHENQDAHTNSTNPHNAVSIPLSAAGPSRAFNNGEPLYPDDPSMPHLEDIYASSSEGIFTDSSYNDEGVVTYFNNFETTMNVSLTPTTRIHTIYPKTQIYRDPMSAVQTQSKVNKNSKAHALISQALEEECWVDAMQEELLQFQIQKARLDAQGHRQEEGIDYDEVFAPAARIEAIRILLAFASYMGFIVYQMDAKSAFLYGQAKKDGIFISQDKYVAKILKKFDFLSVKTVSTPIETQTPLVKDKEAADVDVTLKTSHLQAVKIIFRYLKGQPKLGLWYPKVSSFDLETYLDSDYAGVNLDRKSTIGGRKFNFSKYIFDSMVRNVDSPRKFLMYPWFLQVIINAQVDDLSSHNNQYTSHALTQKVFANMRRVCKGFSRVETLLFSTMLVQPQLPAAEEEDDVEVAALEQEKIAQALEIFNLKRMVKKLEKNRRSQCAGGCIQTEGRIEAIDADEDIMLVDVETQVDAELQGRKDDDNAAIKDVECKELITYIIS
nr:hypothetical protein [Tanacetum cinerariifolium]